MAGRYGTIYQRNHHFSASPADFHERGEINQIQRQVWLQGSFRGNTAKDKLAALTGRCNMGRCTHTLLSPIQLDRESFDEGLV
jgi:hypothetical protein